MQELATSFRDEIGTCCRQIAQFSVEGHRDVVMEFFQNENTNKIIYSTIDTSVQWVGTSRVYAFEDEQITVKGALELAGLSTDIELTYCYEAEKPNVHNFLDTPVQDLPLCHIHTFT